MIMINGCIIADITDFRKHFDLERMLPLSWQISTAKEMFAGAPECEEAQDALCLVLAGRALTLSLTGKYAQWVIDEYSGAVLCSSHELPPCIDGDEAQRLLICQLGDREYVYQSGKLSTQKQKNRSMHSGEMIEYELADEFTIGNLEVVSVKNESVSGDSLISLRYKGDETKIIHIPHGSKLNLLLKGSKVATVIPPISANSMTAFSTSISDDGRAIVYSLDFESGKTSVKKTFDCSSICQVCADVALGFVAMVDHKLHIQSRIVAADSEEDMNIPIDETVVMIGVSGAQIMALTNKGHVYSNFNNQYTQVQEVLRITKLPHGALVAETSRYQPHETPFSIVVGEDSYTFAGNEFIKT